MALRFRGVSIAALIALAACGDTANLHVSQGFGPNPALPPPTKETIPTINIAEAVGWPAGATPRAAAGLHVAEFAGGLDHPRWLLALPNGDILVAETNAPKRPKDDDGLKAYFMKLFSRKAGASTPSANRITLLRDADGDGVVETRSTFLTGLNSPFGMTLVGDSLYVAETDKLTRFRYTPGATSISSPPVIVTGLPAGLRNHHWTKNVIASSDGSKLYVTVGSNSNIAEHGMDEEQGRAAIWEVDAATGRKRLFATGLRNPNGLAWERTTGALWTVVNERDELGGDLVPDYLTSVRDGGFYGWPYSYWGRIDDRVKPQRPDLVRVALNPDYALGPHTASLGLAFADRARLGPRFREGVFIGQHGSWNRNPRSGYAVIFIPFAGGRPIGPPIDVLTGFLTDDGKAQGRPVGVAIDRTGALLVADDVGNKVWRVSAATSAASARPW